MSTQAGNLSFTRIEVESMLPSGWSLPGEEIGQWDPAEGSWRATVLDSVRFEWPLVVKASEAVKQGRLAALQAAIDVLFRQRLGRPTRGLGLAH
jgi:hypothetical protein